MSAFSRAPRPYVDEFVINTLCGKMFIVVKSDTGEERLLNTKCEKIARNIMVFRAKSPFRFVTYIALRYFTQTVDVDFVAIDLTKTTDTVLVDEISVLVAVWY